MPKFPQFIDILLIQLHYLILIFLSWKCMWHSIEPRGLSISGASPKLLGPVSKFATWYCIIGPPHAVITMLQKLSYNIKIYYSPQGPQNILVIPLSPLNQCETVVYGIPLGPTIFYTFLCWHPLPFFPVIKPRGKNPQGVFSNYFVPISCTSPRPPPILLVASDFSPTTLYSICYSTELLVLLHHMIVI